MSGFFRPRNLAIAAGGLGAVVVFFPTSTPAGNVFETPGVRNIGARYSAGGGSTTHVPGVATKRGVGVGDPESNTSPNETPTGVDTPFFQDRQAEQKVGTPGKLGSAYHAAHYGEANSKGK
ncbi:hypothetical protein D0863_07624 [Hortaea werneckii]|uniref:Uncharacterized protein n=1 Tax=Hortaea werneckii TaxID=91943 RepID=A0A3M7DTV4_HORWE|nr:hypothetical protein D0863_07624 [Hortaea werneckii]